jgi:hypothetical protein
MEYDYDFWQASLRGEHRDLIVGRPELGFYRHHSQPVAVWLNTGGQPIAKVGCNSRAMPADIEFCERVFAWCARSPITEQQYRDACDGKPWYDEDPAVKEITALGDNKVDEVQAARDQVEAATASADKYKEIADDETAAKAQSLRARILEIARDVDTRREAEKAPHFEAAKVVDAKWMPLVKTAKAAADVIRKALSSWETAKAKAAREAAPTEPPSKPAPIRGGYGRAAGVKVIRVARMIDQDAVYRTFRDNAELIDLLKKLIQRAVTNAPDVQIPGVVVEEERRVA